VNVRQCSPGSVSNWCQPPLLCSPPGFGVFWYCLAPSEEASRTSTHALSRSPAHLRDAAPVTWCPSEVRPRTPRTRQYSYNLGYVLSRHTEHGRRHRKSHGRRARLRRPTLAVVKWSSRSPQRDWGLLLCVAFCLQKEGFCEWACLDSNQGPLPYQRSTTLCRTFLELAKILQICIFSS
jgi:hypothetical protein